MEALYPPREKFCRSESDLCYSWRVLCWSKGPCICLRGTLTTLLGPVLFKKALFLAKSCVLTIFHYYINYRHVVFLIIGGTKRVMARDSRLKTYRLEGGQVVFLFVHK